MCPAPRLKHRDYSTPGVYCVTVCSDFKRCIFGEIKERRSQPFPLGRLLQEVWLAIPSHFPQVRLHAFAVMPNHFHGIVEIVFIAAARHAAPHTHARPVDKFVGAGSLSAIVRSFKAEVTRRAKLELDWTGNVWQSGYFDRVIRDGREFSDATRYIVENPAKWEWDAENLARKKEAEGNARLAQHAAPLQRRSPH